MGVWGQYREPRGPRMESWGQPRGHVTVLDPHPWGIFLSPRGGWAAGGERELRRGFR